MKRRILCLLLAAAMLLGLSMTALAGEPDAQCAAESLYQLGLFNGTGTYADGSPKFELDRAPTRFEAVTMLVRLLGKGGRSEKRRVDDAVHRSGAVGCAICRLRLRKPADKRHRQRPLRR